MQALDIEMVGANSDTPTIFLRGNSILLHLSHAGEALDHIKDSQPSMSS